MFIQLFYCNCQLVHIAFWVILCSYLVEASNKYFEVEQDVMLTRGAVLFYVVADLKISQKNIKN